MAQATARAGSVSPTRKRTQWLSSTMDSPPGSPRAGGYSFGRAGRFRSVPRNPEILALVLPSTINPRSTSFGFGRRWTPLNATGKDSPPPNNYNHSSDFDASRQIGYTFGARTEAYHEIHRKREMPGPGAYRLLGEMGRQGPKFSFRPRVRLVHYSDTPAPGTYRPNSSLTKDARFTTINFGYGDRISIANKGAAYTASAQTPGPGAYDIRQLFQRVRSKRFASAKRSSVPSGPLPTP